MAIIKRTRSLQGVGILANRSARDSDPEFLRYNLIYGFNGSGKSTLSRLFACLERGRQQDEMPEGCTFEVEMDDGTVYRSPEALSGLETRVCVFNTDFIDRSLQWKTGRAASIFYISEEQADAAAKLREKQTELQGHKDSATAQKDVERARSAGNGVGGDDALTINPDHSVGAGHLGDSTRASRKSIARRRLKISAKSLRHTPLLPSGY